MSRKFGDALRARRERCIAHVSQDNDARPADDQIAGMCDGDYGRILAHAHPDVELQVFAPREFSWTGRARGRAALKAALRHNRATVERRRRRIANVLCQGDAVVLFGREQGRIRQSGEAYEVDFVHRITFRNGRLASVRIIAASSARALRARAVREDPAQLPKSA